MPAPTGLLTFAVSAGLLAGVTTLLTRRLARTPADVVFLAPALVSLQIGLLACLLSLGGWMTPRAWLAGQAAIVAVALAWARSRPPAQPLALVSSVRSWWADAPSPARLAAAAVLVFLLLSAVRQAVGPISGFDDRMYHASRVAYWTQNASILPYPTHNERQVAFPFGSELFFLWPVLFTKAEAAGRLVFWPGYPMAAMGVHLLAGRAGAREPYRSLATLLFVSTPIVSSQSSGLAPEFWLAVFELGTAWWVLETARAEREADSRRAVFWAGLFLFLALNVKTTAIGLALPVLLLPFLIARTARGACLRALAAGSLAGLLLGGLALNAAGNLLRCGHPSASAGLRQVVRSDLDARQLAIHAVRLPLELFELPRVPESLRGPLETAGEAAARALGATTPISFEDWPHFWPGKFHFRLPEVARKYSLGGVLWLPALACALGISLGRLRKEGASLTREPLFLSTLIALSALVPVVFGLRWMVGSGIPSRFLVAPWAFGAVLLAVLVSSRPDAGWRTAAAWIVVGFQAVSSLAADGDAVKAAFRTPPPDAALDEPFSAVLPSLPAGSRVLLFGHQDTRDYPLFRPREGFVNRVIAWGDERPTVEGTIRYALMHDVTRVVFAGRAWLMRGGVPPDSRNPRPMRVAETIAGLRSDPRFRELPSGTPEMTVFAIDRSPAAGKTR